MASKKKKQKEELLKPDAFVEHAGPWTQWLEKNFTRLVGGLVVILGGVLGAQYLAAREARTNAEVTAAFSEAVDAFEEATDLRTVITSTSAALLTKGYEGAQKKFEAFRTAHADHRSQSLAGLYEAKLLERLGKHAEAAALYQSYVDKAVPKDPLLFLALEGLGYAKEAQGQHDQAIQAFKRLAESVEFFRDYGLKHQARAQEAKGDIAGALQSYKAIAEMDPPSKLKSFAESRIQALE